MKYILHLMLLSFFLLPIPTNTNWSGRGSSQQIKLFGYVMDINGDPLASAFVGVSNGNFEYLGGSGTNQKGYYEFYVTKPGTYYLGAQHNSITNPDIYDYISSTKTVETGQSLAMQTDFNLKPAGDILLHIYSDDGKMVRYGELSTRANGHIYVTDLNGFAGYGIYTPVPDEYSQANPSSGWDLQIPAAIVSPNTPIAFHVQWEIPDFGKIILTIDNEGRGYSIGKQGEVLTLNFNSEAAKSIFASLQRDLDLFRSQGYKISSSINEGAVTCKQHLTTGEYYLSEVVPPDMPKAINEFNLSLKSCLWSHEQLILDKAQAEIEKYRKGYITVRVVDQNGKSLPNSAVSAKQISHDFLFGADPTGTNDDSLLYADLLKTAGINYAYIRASYKGIEPNPGEYNWDGTDQWIQDLQDKGFKVFGGLSFWCNSDSSLIDIFCPQYLEEMSFDELKTNVYNHMYAYVGKYKNDIDVWEINEPNASWTNPYNWTWEQRLEIYQAAATGIRNADPTAKVLYDANALPSEFGWKPLEDMSSKEDGIPFPEFLDIVVDRKIPFDVIGLEFYYAGSEITGYTPPGLDLTSVADILDQYSSFGKPIYVRELSAPSSQIPNSSWWHKPWDEETQAEYLTKIYTIAFSKPLVQEIGWSYGVSDEEAFITSGGLLDTQLNPKPSYYALQSLINSWTTTFSGNTDANGVIEFSGFAGDYDITVTLSDGKTQQTKEHIFEQQNKDVTISIPLGDSPTPAVSDPSGYPFTQTWIWIILIIVGILLVILIYLLWNKKIILRR